MWIHLKIQPYPSSETYAHDENIGKRNTAYIESICVKPGYWGGAGGGRLLRLEFHREAKRRSCKFVTGESQI